ncbi:MAG: hypothetical protein A2X12_02830 [Bacteroidetes bacterium GWE2_29_8]|nr:MAG: hypothetical protein A2X12_02830 [Bacteroidetes bacterium GWE2_29_8]OFY24865.1 MAG: hypothetical protein A2X02_03980 [Bacteroidetes bacterium GWF2_29_10]
MIEDINKIRSFEFEAIVIGGSAGSIRIIINLLKALPENYPIPIFLALHRPPDNDAGMKNIFEKISKNNIIEPEMRLNIKCGNIYVAPANYHILIEHRFKINIDSSPLVEFSRPSINVLFSSAADIYKRNLLGVILTGSNNDGASGIVAIKDMGGVTIAQDPSEAFMARMPSAAIKTDKVDYILNSEQITEFLVNLPGKLKFPISIK